MGQSIFSSWSKLLHYEYKSNKLSRFSLYGGFISIFAKPARLFFIFNILIGGINLESFAEEIIIGSGSVTGAHIPIELCYDYSYSQQIYLQSEIGRSGNIDTIYFKYNGYDNPNPRQVTLYFAHTSKSSFNGSSDWLDITQLTQVFSGSYQIGQPAGWYKIILDTPFYYNNSDNLLIAMKETTNRWIDDQNEFYAFSAGGGLRSIFAYQDGSDFSLSTPISASNKGGTSNCSLIKFTINSSGSAPLITMQPQADTAQIGASVSFTVAATGMPIPTYVWQKQISGVWTDIGDTDSIHTIMACTFADSGNYRVIASNAFGSSTSQSANLLVYEPINITTHPQNDTVLAGTSTEFVVVCPSQGLSYQWQRNDGGWHNITTGGTDSVYQMLANPADNGVSFRCQIFSGPISIFSDSALLVIGEIPTINAPFIRDTVLLLGVDMVLSGSASGVPTPTSEWFFINPITSTVISMGMGFHCNLSNVTKADSGFYYFVVSNRFATVSSDTVEVHILTPITVSNDLPNYTSTFHGGSLVLKPELTGDGTFTYQWFQNANPMNGEIFDSLLLNPIDSAIHNRSVYHVEVTSTFAGSSIGSVTSSQCTVIVSRIYNPFRTNVTLHSSDFNEVEISLWSDSPLDNFPVVDPHFPPTPWADSLVIFYKTNGYASDPAGATRMVFPLDTIISMSPNPVSYIVSVDTLPLVNDSSFWFSYSVQWHNPDTLLQPLVQANRVIMYDTVASLNRLVINGEYIMKTDTVHLTIDSITTLNPLRDSVVIVQCSRYQGFDPLLYNDTLTVSSLLASGNQHNLLIDQVGDLPLERDTLYCRWSVMGTNTIVSPTLLISIPIGWDRPVYLGELRADSTFMGDQIRLRWTAPQTSVDSIRIWWNQAPIPLLHNPPLPINQTFYPVSSQTTEDTISNVLTNNTVYYVGLQVFRDDMWSIITHKSSDTVKTAWGNPDTVVNCIIVDSAVFNSRKNSIDIYWRIDLTQAPNGMFFQQGHTVAPDSVLALSLKPVSWDSITQEVNLSQISLCPGIIFDTLYTVGLWLRAYHPNLGPTLPAAPTEQSIIQVAIPTFTWEVVSFFPESSVVLAANNKIILKEIIHFEHQDTIWSYSPSVIPSGFVPVPSVSFVFGNKTPGIPPFTLGISYAGLPPGVNESDLSLYQARGEEFNVFHSFEVKDQAVWVTLTHKDMAFPYVLLADTSAPTITIKPYKDTVVLHDTGITTQFSLKDNVGNVYWQCIYGAGHNAYTHSNDGYLQGSADTTWKIQRFKNISGYESFGIRSMLIVSDGVHRDSINISRCVANQDSEVMSIASQQWIPLRTTKGLDNPALLSIFDHSLSSPNAPWKYNTTEFRLFRWHSDNPESRNGWLEYGETSKKAFAFVPGRIIWCKAAHNHSLSMGAGVTPSLKHSYAITLKPGNWTDLALPFLFPVMLRDILEASALCQDSIDFYQWQQDGNSYVAKDLYIASLDQVSDVKDTIISQQKRGAYTVFNHSSIPVQLFIPPISLPLSQYSVTNSREKTVRSDEDSWDIHFIWKQSHDNENSEDPLKESPWQRVRCGFQPGGGEPLFGPEPPSMSNIKVGIHSQSNTRLSNWTLIREFEQNKGVSYTISMQNQAAYPTKLKYAVNNLGDLAKDMRVKIYDPQKREYTPYEENSRTSIILKANSEVERILAIGTEDYFNYLMQTLLPLQLIKTFPNPFQGVINIHYRLPQQIKEARFTLYTLQGKRLWQRVEHKYVKPGNHILALPTSQINSHHSLAAGVYIMRLEARNTAGKILYGGERRVFCVK